MTEMLNHTWGLRPKCCPTCGSPRFACPVNLDLTTGEVKVQGLEIHLTPREMQVLDALARAYPRGVSKDALLRQIWPDREYSSQAVALMQQHIFRVRKAFEEAGVSATIRTVHGAGYALTFGDRT